MHLLDWLVLAATLVFIVGYGIWKTRSQQSVESYLLGERDLKWWTIGLSIMATQASGITFLSTPGQAYEDGMRFVQFYFGLPLAMVILSVWVIPNYYRLKVYTAYEYLEYRFDLKTRSLTTILFLLQRGLAAGLTIYAPAIIMSSIMGWSLTATSLSMGGLVIIYTVMGGTKAVSETQQQQMAIIFVGLLVALSVVIFKLPPEMSFSDAVGVAGRLGKINLVDFRFDLSNRYNFWSGMLGGTFLFLAYFGTDQSQVQRYLSGKTLTESRLGLLFNGILKVPMQFTVLFVGMMVFVFYQFNEPPIHFMATDLQKLENTTYQVRLDELKKEDNSVFEQKKSEIRAMVDAMHRHDETAAAAAQSNVQQLLKQDKSIRTEVRSLIKQNDPRSVSSDTDYVFINFVTHHLPIGLVGLLIAVIFAASMSSTSSELNALATATVIDIYRRSLVTNQTDAHYLRASQFFTLAWGIVVLIFATTASLFDNLIQAINIIGSIFYGVILGIFLVAFFFKKIGSNATFFGALIAQVCVIAIFILDKYGLVQIAYLWLNLIGCSLVVFFAFLLQMILKEIPKVVGTTIERNF